MKHLLLTLGAIGVAISCAGQIGPNLHLVTLVDKTWGDSYPYQLEDADQFLSDRALKRRERQGIAVDSLDLPVSPEILTAIDALPDWKTVHASKWMASVVVEGRDSTADVEALATLPFVLEVRNISASRPAKQEDLEADWQAKDLVPTTSYGQGWTSMEQLNLASLHALGFQGEGMWIGVMDAGFDLLDTHDAYATLREAGRFVVLPGANIAHGGSDVYAHSKHGTSIMGSLGCQWPDSLIGTAPMATYFPFVTEDVDMERLVEEEHWIVGAERADSLGVDLLNTSLGYSLFDEGLGDYTTSQLDGQTARISRASSIAASRGIVVVTSAGNSGDDPWRRITFPADAPNILSVGAVRANGTHGWFSGYGPTADGRIKPDLMALGVSAPYPSYDGRVRNGNGTSFSAPALCGAAACLWQAHPSATAEDIRHALIQSASLHAAPNDSMGYGIPDLWKAHTLLGGWDGMAADAMFDERHIEAFPNPIACDGTLKWILDDFNNAEFQEQETIHWELVDALGAKVAQGQIPAWTTPRIAGHIELNELALTPGVYTLIVTDLDRIWSRKSQIVVVRNVD